MSKIAQTFEQHAGIWRAAITLGVTAVLGLQTFMLTRYEFNEYKSGHKDFSTQAMEKFESKFDEINRRLLRIETKLDRIAMLLSDSEGVFGSKGKP